MEIKTNETFEITGVLSPIYLVKVVYRGSKSSREYSYYSTEKVEVSDIVTVPLGAREKRAIVTETFEIKPIIRKGE